MYKGYRSRKRKTLDKDIENEIEKNIIISNISNRSKLENRKNKVNYVKTQLSYLNEPTLTLIDIDIKEGDTPIVYDLNKSESINLEREKKNDILEDIDKILMSRDINFEIDNYYNKYNEESSLYLEKELDIDEKEINKDENNILTNIECIKKDKDLICYGLLNKTELNELNKYLNKDILVENKNNIMNKNTEILFSDKEDNSLIKELTFNPNTHMEMTDESKDKEIGEIQDLSIKKEKSYYDRVIDNLYNLFTPK